MTKREAKKVQVGDVLLFSGVKAAKVVEVIEFDPDPRAAVPLFKLDGVNGPVSYKLCTRSAVRPE